MTLTEKVKQSLLSEGLRRYKIVDVEDDANWLTVFFQSLDFEDLNIITNWIGQTFYDEGKHTHMLPKLTSVTNKFGNIRTGLVMDSKIAKEKIKI